MKIDFFLYGWLCAAIKHDSNDLVWIALYLPSMAVTRFAAAVDTNARVSDCVCVGTNKGPCQTVQYQSGFYLRCLFSGRK